MSFNGAPKDGSINSKPIQTKVGTRQTNIFTATSTKVTQGSDGKVNGGTTTLYYSATPNNFVPAATSTDGGKTWTYLNDSNGKPVLGADAKNSLETGALKNHTQAQIQSASTSAGIPKEQQKALATQTQNTAVGAAASTTTPQFSQEDAIAAIKGLDVRTNYANLSYPQRRSKKQDYIKFEMLEYSPRKYQAVGTEAFNKGIDQGLGQEVFGDRSADRKTLGSVSLPISSPISDTNAVSWNDNTINGLQALGSSVFSSLVGGTTTQPNDGGGSGGTGGAGGNSSDATKALIMPSLISAAMGGGTDTGNLLTRTTGAIVNPNLELLFNGPSLRTFSFTFPLLARSKEESEIILQIIRFFKQGMSVKRSTSAIFLKSPHTFRIKYIYATSDQKEVDPHPWLNKFKECALTNCSVNYTPSGNYATYANGAMTMYEITLNFSELEPVFDDDYGNKDGKPETDIKEGIGY